MSDQEPGPGRPPARRVPRPLVLVAALFVVLVAVALGSRFVPPERGDTASLSGRAASPDPSPSASPPPVPTLPGGRSRVFDGRFLVAYYGTAQTPALGVLGEGGTEEMTRRLRAAAAPFHRAGQQPQIVYELIVSVADRTGDKTHDVPRAEVQRYIDLAHRNDALLLLDLQTGTQDFTTVAKRWSWALADPWVGLALDPEWRMYGGQVPGTVIGHVSRAEVNRTARWLSDLTAARRLPEKVFMLHQFRTSMVRGSGAITPQPHLAMVQHADGFGAPGEKLSTYRAVAEPGTFRMGFKLFYDEDRPRMSAQQVLALRPRVDFVSFQ